MKSNHVFSCVSAMVVVVALHGSGCASQANDTGFMNDDGGGTPGQSSGSGGGNGTSTGNSSSSGSGGGSGGANSSGGGSGGGSGAVGGSGSSSSGAGNSASSSGSKASDGGGACVSACKADQDCQSSCGAVRAGYVWCCGNSTCYQWTSACPVLTDAGSSSGASSSGSSSGGGSSGGGAEAGVSDAVCQAMSTSAACQQCCVTNHMHGYNTYLTSLTGCACGTSGVCKTQCATEFCASAQTTMGDACDTCLNNALSADAGGTCLTPVTNACIADSDCLALLSTTGCVSGCP